MRARGVRMDDLAIRVAFVTAERLYDDQKALIASTFARRERVRGATRASLPNETLRRRDAHLGRGRHRRDRQCGGSACRRASRATVVTHLATGYFLFIRYRTGDVGILDAARCPCGRGLPLLREVQGRTTDFVVAADGTVMHGLALVYVVRDLPGIGAFKIVQESPERTRVLVVPASGYAPSVEDEIRKGSGRAWESVDVIVERVTR
jgi:phenylacetate-CoA ligase